MELPRRRLVQLSNPNDGICEYCSMWKPNPCKSQDEASYCDWEPA